MLISNPPSKRITISTIEVNIVPAFPKKSGYTSPKTGPIMIPINSNSKTSGIFFVEKIIAKRCAAKINSPIKIIASPIS